MLEIRNSRDAASRLDDDERMTLDRNSNRVANADSIDGCVAASMGSGGDRNSRQTANRLGHDENATLDRNRNGVANADSIEGCEAATLNSEIDARAQQITIINESGLYSLIMISRKPAAKRFRKWVTSEVLPSIRKTGSYGARPAGADLNAQRQALRLIGELKREGRPEIRRSLHTMLDELLRGMNVPTPPLEAIGRDAPAPPPILESFWEAVAWLENQGIEVNHSRDPGLLALNLPDLRRHFQRAGIAALIGTSLRDAMKRMPSFVGANKAVNSRITGETTKCWVFLLRTGQTVH
ncbi:MAG: hypothetical protein HQL38_19690 [Alphaproteobacteria bacterium]|nr:hypothetical protein [Alphaproteobacteria bacterium]